MAHHQSLKKVKTNISRLRGAVPIVIILALLGSVAVLGVYSYQLTKSKATGGFDRVAAKKAGYTDQEIDQYLECKEKAKARGIEDSCQAKGRILSEEEVKQLQLKEPSERALKVATYIYVNVDKKGRYDLEQRMMATGSSDLTIKRMAMEFDNDLSKLIYAETVIQKNQTNQGGNSGSTNTYNPPATIVRPDSNSESTLDKYQRESRQRCQEETNRYTVCLSEYNLKMNEYQDCLSEKVTNEWKFCYKPINSCGFKPFCTY